MKIFKINKYVIYSLFALLGLFIGWLLFHSSRGGSNNENLTNENIQGTIWTCSMHPQIRKDGPGKCPICGMDLIPLLQKGADIDSGEIRFSKEAIALAEVSTSIVTRHNPIMEVRLYGKIKPDERLTQSISAHFPGRIEKLFVNFTGESVKKGQKLAVIYSPELVTAQQEFLETIKSKDSNPEIYLAARQKLLEWKLTHNQINEIESSSIIKNNFEIISTSSGIVISKKVKTGDYIGVGSVLFEIEDLSSVWAMFDAYESDLPFIKVGDLINFSVEAIPGKNYSGKILFIDPVINSSTRVAQVRVEVSNPSGILKPDMYATGMVRANLSAYRNKLVIPQSAVLWTGKRSIVYVKTPDSEEALFKLREIDLGPALGNSYIVLGGLMEREEIVTHGAFSIDAESQLEGKPSMMNPKKQ